MRRKKDLVWCIEIMFDNNASDGNTMEKASGVVFCPVRYGCPIGSFAVGEKSTQSLPFAVEQSLQFVEDHIRRGSPTGMWASNGLHHL